VIGDYRAPDRLRLGPVPITTRYADVWSAMDITRRILAGREYEGFPAEPAQVT
jgi:kynureninase